METISIPDAVMEQLREHQRPGEGRIATSRRLLEKVEHDPEAAPAPDALAERALVTADLREMERTGMDAVKHLSQNFGFDATEYTDEAALRAAVSEARDR